MRLSNFLLLTTFGLFLVGCTSTDPSVSDVKSPCVSAGSDAHDPCVRRKPIDNFVA